MDTPYGRFAVLIPPGLPAGTPLLVPVPSSGAPAQIGASPGDIELDKKKEAQLTELLSRGFSAAAAAPYCDGVSSVDELAELIRSDGDALEHTDAGLDLDGDAAEPLLRTPRAGGSSSFCVVS